jgi:hypothetical protein
MNKYLMLTAAAVLAGTAGASAGGTCFQFTFGTAGGGSYCDGGNVYTGVDNRAYSGVLRAWRHTNNNCNGGQSSGYGILGKLTGLGKVSFMSDNIEAQNYGNYSTSLNYTLPKKIKNGQPWGLWIGLNGTTLFYGNSGVLVNASKCQNGPMSHGSKSTVEGVKAVIQAHRKATKS